MTRVRFRGAALALSVAWLSSVCWLSAVPALEAQLSGSAQRLAEEATRAIAGEEEIEEPLTAEAVAESRRQLAEQIRTLEAQQATAGRETSGIVDPLSERLARLRDIDQVLARQLSELARQQRLREELEELDRLRLEGAGGMVGHPPPFSVAELDQVAERRRRAAEAVEILERAVEETAETLGAARSQTAERERERRRAREQVDAGGDAAAAAGRQRRLELAEVGVRLAAARQELLELELENTRASLELEQQRVEHFAATEQQVREELAPSDDEREQRLFELEEAIAELERKLDDFELEIEAARERWSAARRRLDESEPPPEGLSEEVEARRLELEELQRRQEAAEDGIRRLEESRRIVDTRFKNLSDELSNSEKEAEAAALGELVSELERAQRRTDGRILQTRAEVAEVDARLAGQIPGTPVHRWLGEQRAHLQAIAALYEQEIAELEALSLRVQVTVDELQQASNWERFRAGLRRSSSAAVALWQFEVFVVQDQSITVGKILLTLVLLLLGYFVAKRFAHFLGHRVFPRLGLHPAAAAAFQTLIFYFLVVLLALYALNLVNIPLTVFTVLGGALALGVGFGSQNIVNNFISGLIILAERPIKVGDLVDVDGIYGRVEQIGMRSTRIRSGDNTHIIVPNSAFLEKNVLNWTLSDETIRTHLDVGVAYGSPTEEVTKLLYRAMDKHERVLESPEPEVLFIEFGDNALIFRAYFWIRIRRVLDRVRLQSDLRYRIDRLFQEAGITIAFPQRDVHFDADAPLRVQMVNPPPSVASDKDEGSS